MNPRRRRGASAVEFALTLPVLFAVFSGIMEYGMVFFSQVGVINAVRDGARMAVSAEETDAIDTATARAYEVLEEFGIPCDTSGGCSVDASFGTGPSGYQTLIVDADVPYDELFGIIPTPPLLRGRIVMRYESLDFED